jgi:hypothetical protein
MFNNHVVCLNINNPCSQNVLKLKQEKNRIKSSKLLISVTFVFSKNRNRITEEQKMLQKER